jgi:hypothetical protein
MLAMPPGARFGHGDTKTWVETNYAKLSDNAQFSAVMACRDVAFELRRDGWLAWVVADMMTKSSLDWTLLERTDKAAPKSRPARDMKAVRS